MGTFTAKMPLDNIEMIEFRVETAEKTMCYVMSAAAAAAVGTSAFWLPYYSCLGRAEGATQEKGSVELHRRLLEASYC